MGKQWNSNEDALQMAKQNFERSEKYRLALEVVTAELGELLAILDSDVLPLEHSEPAVNIADDFAKPVDTGMQRVDVKFPPISITGNRHGVVRRLP